MAMVELDRREFLLTPQETPPPAGPPTPSIWEQWLPALGSVITLAMLGAMVQTLGKEQS